MSGKEKREFPPSLPPIFQFSHVSGPTAMSSPPSPLPRSPPRTKKKNGKAEKEKYKRSKYPRFPLFQPPAPRKQAKNSHPPPHIRKNIPGSPIPGILPGFCLVLRNEGGGGRGGIFPRAGYGKKKKGNWWGEEFWVSGWGFWRRGLRFGRERGEGDWKRGRIGGLGVRIFWFFVFLGEYVWGSFLFGERWLGVGVSRKNDGEFSGIRLSQILIFYFRISTCDSKLTSHETID